MKLINECRLCLLQGGPGNADKPFVWLRLEAITNFEDPAKVKSLTPLLYSFMKDELKLEKVKFLNLKQKEMLFQEWIIINFYKLEATHVATMGKTIAE